MTEPAAGLFDEDAVQETEGPLLFVTNRYNLLEFLSAGYVTPAVAIPKYYGDLLELAPGRIPILRAPVSDSVVAEVSREDATAFPVALELDPSAPGLDAKVPSIDSAGNEASRPIRSDADAYAPSGVLPLTSIIAVHFRSQDELGEHTARQYENIRSSDISLAVTPDLFGGRGVSMEDLRAFLVALPPVDAASKAFFDEIDRVNGARAMLVSLCPPREDALRAVASVVAGKPPRSSDDLPPWIAAPLLSEPPNPAGAEAILFSAACAVLRQEDASAAWRPAEVLGRVEAWLGDAKVAKRDEAEISKNLRPIGAILRNERDFKPFERDSGLSAAKALLLLLLRPDPLRLSAWERSETGADDEVMEAAGILVGLLRGHKRLSLEVRTPGLDRLLAARAAAAASALPDAFRPPPGGSVAVTEETTEDGGAVVRLLWDDRVLAEKHRTRPTATERLLSADLAGSTARETAIEVCRRLGWSDCATTSVWSSQGEFAMDTKAKAVRIVLPGVAQVTHELDDEKFRTRLSKEGMSKDLEAEVDERLGP